MIIFAHERPFRAVLPLPKWAKILNYVPIMYHLKIISREIERPFQPQRAEFLGIASLALGIGSSILGGVSSANAAKRAEKLRQEQDAKNDAWFARRYNESYIDTAAGRNAIRQATDYARTIAQRAEGAAAVTGGTDAAVAQAKEGANKMIGDTIGNLAAQDTARKEQAEATYLRQQEQSTAQQMANQQQRANAIAQAASGASNALIAGAQMLGKVPSSNTSKINSANMDAAMGKDAGLYAKQGAMSVSQPTLSSIQQGNVQLSSHTQTELDYYTRKHGALIGKDGLIG